MSQDCVAISKRQPEIFAASTRLRKCAPGRLHLKVGRAREVSTHRPWMEYAYANDPAPSDAAGKTAPYHLDLRKLGHRSPSAVLRRRERTCLSSANDDEVGGLQSVIRSERSEQSNPGSRAAVLRRSERTCLSSANDDEVGGLQSVIRSERSEQSNPGSRAAVLRRNERTCLSSANDDEVGGLQSVIRSERSEQSNPGSRAAVLRRNERTCL